MPLALLLSQNTLLSSRPGHRLRRLPMGGAKYVGTHGLTAGAHLTVNGLLAGRRGHGPPPDLAFGPR